MAVVEIERGGVYWWCVTASETPTWRLFWDEYGIVIDFHESDQEDWTIVDNNVFEGQTRQECIDKIAELQLYFDPDVET